MSRRTFPRAAAAGLVAAAVGTPSPAVAQAPNPWRGETAPQPRQIVVGLGYTSNFGLTGSVQLRTAPVPRPMPAPSAIVDLDLPTGTCPAAAQLTAQAQTMPVDEKPVATNSLKDLVAATAEQAGDSGGREAQALATPRYLEHYPTYFPPDLTFPLPRELAAMADPEPEVVTRSPLKATPATVPAPLLQRVEYTVPVTPTATPVMPPPAPLPVTRPTTRFVVPAQYQVEITTPTAIPPAQK